MKKVLTIMGLCFAMSSFGQNSATETQGYRNGCTSGRQTAFNQSSFTYSLATIMNSSLSFEYKTGYSQGMYICAAEERKGVKTGGISGAVKCKILHIISACSKVNNPIGADR